MHDARSPRRRTGRPPLASGDPSVNLHVRVTSSQFDAVYERARAERLTMCDWLRRVVREATRRPARQ